ncbi:type VII secretion target [Actinoplanes sp. NPDC051851]|uniref:type VII secretion target n=1 Tax=Actinoplanes sp. NPDC051851 TaxID=3154753 RepID=UPI003426308E
MTGPMSATPGELRRHAAHLETIAQDLGAAHRAAGRTAPAPDSYGRLCVMVPDLLVRLQTPLTEALEAAAGAIARTASSVHGAAESYELTDEDAAGALRHDGPD